MPELIEAYPEAKVIICMRDPDKWFESFKTTIVATNTDYMFAFLRTIDTKFLQPWGQMLGVLAVGLWGPKGFLEPEEKIKKIYIERHEEVRRLVPKERRLEYQLGMGWEPLCEFLGKDIPDEEFPHINETKDFIARIDLMKKNVIKRLALGVAPYLTAVTVAGVGLMAYTTGISGSG
jgi:hypothetical protein